MKGIKSFDVIIIGGSYAGLSAAMALGRSLRDVLIIDSGLPCNRQTPHSHNFITQDGETPATIAAKARAQVMAYDTVQFISDLAISGKKSENVFTISTQRNGDFISKKLIFATGIKDILPDVKGLAECWGISVIHCPYCHGYEFRHHNTSIMANGEKAFHLASLIHNLTDKLTILTSGEADFSSEQMAKLSKHNILVMPSEIAEITHDAGQIRQVIFKDGNKADFKALYAAVPFIQHSEIPVTLGCALTEHGYIKVDELQRTTVEGVFACGDNSSPMRSVANAVYRGNLTGAIVNKALVDEQF